MSVTHVAPTGLVGAEEWTAEHVVSITAADIGAAEDVHTHDYAATAHTHDTYAASDHTHDASGLTHPQALARGLGA